MARVTVEDCVDKIPNRFELVLLASQRARAIAAGSPVTLERDNDKNPVVALREVADETISPEELTEDAIYSLRKHVEVDEPEEDDMSLLMAAQSQSGGEEATSDAHKKDEAEALPPTPPSAYAEEVSEFSGGAVSDANSEVGTDGMAANYFANDASPAKEDAPAKEEGSADLPASDDVMPPAGEPGQD